MILPLVGAVDTFWVGRMENALALAGQAAANQIFSSAFWVIAFLPSVVAPVVAKAAATGDKETVRKRVGEAVYVSILMGCVGMILVDQCSEQLLNLVMSNASPAREFAEPYLSIRAYTFIPALVATVGFAAFRGTMDVVTPLKISFLSNLLNIIADPIFMFRLGMGVAGAAVATGIAEMTSAAIYLWLMTRRKLASWSHILRPPPWSSLKTLLLGGTGVQLRSVALNVAFISVQRTTLALDSTGTAAAAHAITVNLWQVGQSLARRCSRERSPAWGQRLCVES
ncbi:hypothetical protein CYMTET_32643 [Cymbomonas tetramitiformis]|uniref:Uncharacterized protein n=1 Tax=Cymbomonas tetramitiformis TaxID=36881 RepID=A0AAE0FEC7_9CHLO|nr:hypothetical protein CYMTET_32643 [Cymbomonas tetramitiformis]